MENRIVAVGADFEQLLDWCGKNPHWQAVLASDHYRKQAIEAWEYVSRNGEHDQVQRIGKEYFLETLKKAMCIEFVSEILGRFLAGEESWEETTVDNNWLDKKMQVVRESATAVLNKAALRKTFSQIILGTNNSEIN